MSEKDLVMNPWFLDTEFNGYRGELISLALYSLDIDPPFYEVVSIPDNCDPWVKYNVIPQLNKKPIGIKNLKIKLNVFIREVVGEGCTIFADWPDDFAYLMNCLSFPGGRTLTSSNWPITMQLIRSGQLFPGIPHNALSDAKALAQWWKEQQEK